MEANITAPGDDNSTNVGTLNPLLYPSHPPSCQYPSQWIDVAVMEEKAATDHDLASIFPSKTLITEGSELSSTLSRCGSPSAYSSSHPYSADLFQDTEHSSSRMNLPCHEVRDIPKHFAVIRDTITTLVKEGSSTLGHSMNEKEVSHLIEIQISTPDSMKISLEDDGCDNNKREDVRMKDFFSHNGRCSMMRNCFHCGTTKTPLWRSGPQGPKSLCNACGIRFKKSRKYTGGFESSDIPGSPNTNGLPHKRKQEIIRAHSKSSGHHEMSGSAPSKQAALYHRRTARWPALSQKRFEKQNLETTGSSLCRCMTWNLKSPSTSSLERKGFMKGRKGDKSASSFTGAEKHGSITRVFAKDEEEAAVLLMALSCGLVRA